jgi:membrane protein DedA with SNARE-associated domain
MKDMAMTIFDTLAQMGYYGIALGLMIEIIPSEIVLSYGGYLIKEGELQFLGALLAGIIGGTIAQVFLYLLGSYGGRPFLYKYGKFLLIHKHHLDLAESWFQSYGTGVIFSARFIPVVRHAISIPAGIAKMPLSLFTTYTVAAMIPWTVLFLLLGMELGEHWQEIGHYSKPFLVPIVTLSILGIIGYFTRKHFRRNKK